MILRTMTSPRPVLDSPEVAFTLSLGNGLKSLSISAGEFPDPYRERKSQERHSHAVHLLPPAIAGTST